MKNNNTYRYGILKLTQTMWLTIYSVVTVMLIGCGDDLTKLGEVSVDINDYTLSYDDITMPDSTPSYSPATNTIPASATVTYSIAPDLPLGLTFDSSTGVITGTPSNTVTNSYTVTATGVVLYFGSISTTFTITVTEEAFLNTLNFSYSNLGVSYDNTSNEIYTINIDNTPNPTITDLIPQWSNGSNTLTPTDVTYTVNPPLPYWLSFNVKTGIISSEGSPTAYYRSHTVRATGQGAYVNTAFATLLIAIAVNANNANIQALVNEQIIAQGNEANLNIIDTSQVTDMNDLFFQKTGFNGDISSWDVSGVTNMRSMFYYAYSFNGDISSWDVSRVTDMRSMFKDTSQFNGNLSNWNVSNVTDMAGMFWSAKAFHGTGLSSWAGKLGNVNDMRWMFTSATAMTEDLEPWNTSNNINILGNWDASTQVAAFEMFIDSAANPPVWYRTLS